MNMHQYIREIADRTCLPNGTKCKIIKDLRQEFEASLSQGYTEEEVMQRMGKPDDIAAGLYDNYISAQELIRPFSEYKSETELWGMPLVHIVRSNRPLMRTNRNRSEFFDVPEARGIIAIGRRARGIFALGNISMGVIAIGNISIGLLAISNIGLGLFAFGNIGLGLLLAIANAAIGLCAIGNFGLGYGAVANDSIGCYAIGHEALGKVFLPVNSFTQQAGEIEVFIQTVPAALQGFFRAAISLLQNWGYLIAAAIFIIVIVCLIYRTAIKKLKSSQIS